MYENTLVASEVSKAVVAIPGGPVLPQNYPNSSVGDLEYFIDNANSFMPATGSSGTSVASQGAKQVESEREGAEGIGQGRDQIEHREGAKRKAEVLKEHAREVDIHMAAKIEAEQGFFNEARQGSIPDSVAIAGDSLGGGLSNCAAGGASWGGVPSTWRRRLSSVAQPYSANAGVAVVNDVKTNGPNGIRFDANVAPVNFPNDYAIRYAAAAAAWGGMGWSSYGAASIYGVVPTLPLYANVQRATLPPYPSVASWMSYVDEARRRSAFAEIVPCGALTSSPVNPYRQGDFARDPAEIRSDTAANGDPATEEEGESRKSAFAEGAIPRHDLFCRPVNEDDRDGSPPAADDGSGERKRQELGKARKAPAAPKKVRCDIEGCNFATTTLGSLKQHKMHKHSIGVTWFYCNQERCNYRAKSRCNLQSHVREVHGIGTKWYYCGIDNCTHKAKRKNAIEHHRLCIHGKARHEWACPRAS